MNPSFKSSTNKHVFLDIHKMGYWVLHLIHFSLFFTFFWMLTSCTGFSPVYEVIKLPPWPLRPSHNGQQFSNRDGESEMAPPPCVTPFGPCSVGNTSLLPLLPWSLEIMAHLPDCITNLSKQPFLGVHFQVTFLPHTFPPASTKPWTPLPLSSLFSLLNHPLLRWLWAPNFNCLFELLISEFFGMCRHCMNK